MRSKFKHKTGVVALVILALAGGIWLGNASDITPAPQAQIPAVSYGDPVPTVPVQATESIYSDDSPIVRVVEQVKDAVVNIEAESEPDERQKENWLPFFHPPTGRSKSYGSGFFIRPDGTILTNAHVVGDADLVMVRLSDEVEYEAEILGTDKQTDLAVIRINSGKPMPYIELGQSEKIKIGQWVVAIGNPFPRQHLDRTVTVGVVSGVGRSALFFGSDTPRYQNYIQTDAAINPGNSGGPLIDLHGRAIGVNAAIASPSGGNVGIGFAIPVAYVKAILDDLITDGKVTRGWLGIEPGEISPDLAEAMELESKDGVVVQQVVKDTPAAEYGIKQGDVIVRFNDERIVDVQQFMFLVAETRPNTDVTIDVIRDGDRQTLTVRLAERREEVIAERPSQGDETPDSWFGMKVHTATSALAERFSVGFEEGVIVTEVEPGSPADGKGIARGDIITSIERQDVGSVEDFTRIRSRYVEVGRPVLFLIQSNDGQPRFVALKAQ
jgi:serine protease Do